MSVDLLFKKYFYAIVLVLVALAAFFQASGISHLVGAQLAPGSGPTFGPLATVKVDSRERPRAEAIHSRNPFDSVTGPLNAPEVDFSEDTQAQASFDDPLTVPSCSGVSVLILTESDDPLWSFAAIQSSGESGPKLRRVGDSVGDRKVAYIGYNPGTASPTVWLEGSDLCQSSLFGGEVVPPASPVKKKGTSNKQDTEPKTAKKSSSSAISPEIKKSIKKISDTEIEIDRSAVDKILEDQAQLMRSARIVPETEGWQDSWYSSVWSSS